MVASSSDSLVLDDHGYIECLAGQVRRHDHYGLAGDNTRVDEDLPRSALSKFPGNFLTNQSINLYYDGVDLAYK